VVQNCRLGRASGRAVVMARDRVEELGEDGGVEIARALLDRSQPQVDMAEQASLFRLAECGAATELSDTSDIVQKRSGEQEISAQAGVQLRGLAAECRDADRVLE
jgi:hypothetical protein